MRRLLSLAAACGLALAALPLLPAGAQENTTADRAIPLTGAVSGALTGSSAGAYAYYRFDYPGKNQVAHIELRFTPGDRYVARAAGFKLYRGDSEVVDRHGEGGREAVAFYDLDRGQAASYTIQVYNYNQGTTINFTLSVSGIALPTPIPAGPAAVAAAPTAPTTGAPPPAASPAPPPTLPALGQNTTPASALPLDQERFATLPGTRGGYFHFYRFAYPVDGYRDVTVEMNYTPGSGLTKEAVGLYVYRGDDRVGSLDREIIDGRGVAKVHLVDRDPDVYYVQVFNYTADTTIDYSVKIVKGPR